MRSISGVVGLIVLAGCSHMQRPAPVHRAAVSAAACDSAASIAGQRATLASVAASLGELGTGTESAAYATVQEGGAVASTSAASASPSPKAAAATASMIANANNARVQLLYGEARLDREHRRVVAGQVAALDAIARTLPTVRACHAAGFTSGKETRG